MFDFLYQEEFWMETIVAAVITGAITLIGIMVTYNYKAKQFWDKIDTIAKHEGLSKEHIDLGKEHTDLSKEHKELSKEHRQINDTVSEKVSGLSASINENKEITRSVKEMLVEDKTKSECQYSNLTEKQKAIIDSISKLENFAEELKTLQQEKTVLLNQNQNLKSENLTLKKQCEKQLQIISTLTEDKHPHRDRGIER